LKQISVEGAVTEFNYDFMGRITSVTEPNEAQTFTTYDLKGHVTQITNLDDTTKTNVYNTIANTITSTDENGIAIVYTYNALGRLLTSRQQGKAFDSAKFTYDSSLRAAREYDAKGAYTSYVYDAFDRVTSKTAPSSLYQETYDYDDAYTTSLTRVLKTIVSSATNAPAIKSAQYINKAGQQRAH
jgi:YD repeat-containing protein